MRTTAESEVAAPTAPLSSQVYQLARFFTAHRLDAPHHSLGYMAMRVTELRGDGSGQLASTRRRVALRGLRNRLARRARREPTNLPGDDGLRARPSARCNGRTPPRLAPQTPASSRPGGFKRRSRIVSREEFHARARNRSGITPLGSSPSTASKSSRSNSMDRLTEAGHSLTRQDFAVAAARASSVQIARHPRTEASACCCISTSPTARAALRSEPKNLAALCDDGLVLVGREHAVGPCGCFA